VIYRNESSQVTDMSRSHRRTAIPLGLLAVLVIAASACSSNTASSTSPSVASGNPIIVGGIGTAATSAGPVYPNSNVGAEALFARVNKDGGIDGRKIDFLGVSDDGGSSATALTDAKNLVLSKHVVAVVPVVSLGFSSETANFLAQSKVPYFQQGLVCTNWGYGIGGCINSPTSVNTGLIAPLTKIAPKGSTLALACTEDTLGEQSCVQSQAAAARKIGYNVVFAQRVLPDTAVSSYTPIAIELMHADHGHAPDIIGISTGALGTLVGLAAELKQLQYHGIIFNYIGYSPGLLQSSKQTAEALDDTYTVNIETAAQEQGGPAINQMVADLKAIGASTTITQAVAVGYWAAEEFVAAAEQAAKTEGVKNLSGASIQAALSGKSGWTWHPLPAGAVGAVTFPADYELPSGCADLVKATGSSYQVLTNFSCYPVSAG
jgi:branched-chain amino acid transport system substrate-binding protein